MRAAGLAAAADAPDPLGLGWIYAFGLYQPRWKMARHLNSDWSQAVVLAKRKSEAVIEGFGRIIARHLETALMAEEQYVITHVPAAEDQTLYLFVEFGRCATEVLAEAIYSHLRERRNVMLASLLAQVRPKGRKQHQCGSDTQRAENVRGVYVANREYLAAGKNVILVDDVITSGATMRECAAVLKRVGARSVMGIALARTERVKMPPFGSSCRWRDDADAA